MRLHKGRLLDHVHLRVADLERSKVFYRAALGALGRGLVTEDKQHFSSDELYVDGTDEVVSRVHLAFHAEGEEQVKNFYEAALKAGGRDNGAPGDRAYHPGYYSAFVLDPDGNNIEAVWHGAVRRSSPSVTLDRD